MIFKVKSKGTHVILAMGDKLVFDEHWSIVDASLAELRNSINKAKKAEVVNESDNWIRFSFRGKFIFSAPYQLGEKLWAALVSETRKAEELDKFDQVAMDQAIATRSGMPIGFAHDKRVQEEGKKLACWDSGLRRYINKMGGVKGRNFVGAPSVYQHKNINNLSLSQQQVELSKRYPNLKFQVKS